ncbi:unnamed protein product, partial [Mesorhabditis belari]|uniref:EGF-like domain-containing protein n=1 Tax=Mesorhabditis belari TaxID=2138241 RepID=A0AAF3JA12_9BILA
MLATGPGRPLYGILAFILLFAPLISAHIRLVFPPARQPALDSYSTSNAEPPCGVPKPPQGQGVHTFLQAGSEVDVEWINAIPHMGGIRIEVLNALDQPIAIFTNFIDPYNISHPTKKISLPKQFECQNCALRLSHQATEYGTEYQFFSCADVNIVNTIPDGDSCSGNGQRMNGECECDDKFTGNYCHIENECAQETDCGTHGVCRSTLDQPRGQCFCQKGYFGKTCDKVSRGPNNPNDFDPTLYNLRQADDNKIYWRILEDEIEFVLKFPGKSWAGIGWKPQDFVCPTIIPQPPLHQQKEVTYPQKSAIEKETILKKVDSAPNAKLPTAENADSKASHRPLPASVTFVQKAPKSEKVTEDDEEDKSDDFSVDAESTEYGGEETELPFKVTPDMMSAEHSTVPTTVAKTTVATKATAVTIAQEEESEEAEVVEDTKKPKSDLETTTATKATTKAKLQVEIGVSDPDLAEEDEKSGNTCGENEEFNKCPEMSRECEASCDWTR